MSASGPSGPLVFKFNFFKNFFRNTLSVLTWIQTDSKGCQQATKVAGRNERGNPYKPSILFFFVGGTYAN